MLVLIMTPSRKVQVETFERTFQGSIITWVKTIKPLCRFTFFAVAAPGGSSDLLAFVRTKQAEYTESLGDDRYLIAYTMYTCRAYIDPTGRFNSDTFDFYVSQLKIRFEHTFGRFNNTLTEANKRQRGSEGYGTIAQIFLRSWRRIYDGGDE